ncbi:DNA cytosine methyltransferase [Pseudonocardia humida]|uniref:Cytosine-specific methyltransferase n=1 Tax=Pseudonocardia humida TaxID=2800819 RepID=A0ABT1A7A4_9PSEU|nr:DNA (cytosine-5-)-methyltransferase [Pseudonocardia humida]MCO1658905.1 DNA (cytosine-5-)-methyltransferase [Pseudonocardia humida]
MDATFTVAGLFAGIGGLELGLQRAGGHTELLCECWAPAQLVLAEQWPETELHSDVRTLAALPSVDVVTAGFPCQDLSQAGRTAGITGANSSLVSHVFRLLKQAQPRWLVLENVRNMLVLDKGRAMRYLIDELEGLGYRWAYRLVDSRSSGVPQRRQRVLLVASRTEDPRSVLMADEAGELNPATFADTAHGFYWTEGLTGVGWAKDALPTLKGGSSVGIPSPPAAWVPSLPVGRQIITPIIEDAEALQGFPRGWTAPAQVDGKRNGPRWKLVGNAVTVGVSAWLGRRLSEPGEPITTGTPFDKSRWPTAAWGGAGRAWASPLSMWPVQEPYSHLVDVLDLEQAVPLSHRATAGFVSRAERSTLRFDADFLVALKDHLRIKAAELGAA